MKVILIAAMSADGYIARSANELANWTSKEDKKHFAEITKHAGAIVMGRTTYDTIGKPLPERRNIIYSHKAIETNGIEVTQEQPKELMRRLESEGFGEIAICGGQSIYQLFLNSGVVNELYLTVEPVLFGRGVRLFNGTEDKQLTLLDFNKLNDNTVLLHYKSAEPES